MTTELEELIEFYKFEAAGTRINYPELSERYRRTAKILEQLNELVNYGVVKLKVKK